MAHVPHGFSLATLGLGLAVVLVAGCEPNDEPSSVHPAQTAHREDAIRNGTREPQLVPLLPGQVLAIGWLQGGRGDAFCTGTLVAPDLVVTAQHCTYRRPATSLFFGVGMSNYSPEGTFRARSKYEHPSLDVSFLRLDGNATDRVPELIPISVNLVPLTRELIGREVEAGGHGETYDARRHGRYFAVVQVVALARTELVVDGRGVQGICFGDSGGPVITTDESGMPVVLGVESWGDQSCVGRDHLTRLDAVSEWIEPIVGTDPSVDECDDLSQSGRCEGNVAQWCSNGRVLEQDCNRSNQVCGQPDAQSGFRCLDGPPCGDIGGRGVCDGDVLVRCRNGHLQHLDCAESGGSCDDTGLNAVCLSTPAADAEPIDGGAGGDAGVVETPDAVGEDAWVDPAPPPDSPGTDEIDAGGDLPDFQLPTNPSNEHARSGGGCQLEAGARPSQHWLMVAVAGVLLVIGRQRSRRAGRKTR